MEAPAESLPVVLFCFTVFEGLESYRQLAPDWSVDPFTGSLPLEFGRVDFRVFWSMS